MCDGISEVMMNKISPAVMMTAEAQDNDVRRLP
jgi:hypothetical protein